MNIIRKLLGFPRTLLTEQELASVRDLNRIVQAELFKFNLIKGNTARFKNKQLALDQQTLYLLIKDEFNQFTSLLFSKMGYANGEMMSINLRTGEVSKQNVATDDTGTEKAPAV